MEREKLLAEYRATLESLIEKTKYVYSKNFYELDEITKEKYVKDKMATEGHLNTLCSLLWNGKPTLDNGLMNLFGLGILGSMFNYGSFGNSSSSSIDALAKQIEEDSKKEQDKDKVYAIPEN